MKSYFVFKFIIYQDIQNEKLLTPSFFWSLSLLTDPKMAVLNAK